MGNSAFRGKMIPVKIRTAFGLILSLIINPLVPAKLEIADHFAGAIILSINEICIGLLLAMVVRMVFFAVELAGHLISYEIGLMASNSVNPFLVHQILLSLHFYIISAFWFFSFRGFTMMSSRRLL